MQSNLQRIDVKLLLDCPRDPDLDQFLVIFDRWRKADDHPPIGWIWRTTPHARRPGI